MLPRSTYTSISTVLPSFVSFLEFLNKSLKILLKIECNSSYFFHKPCIFISFDKAISDILKLITIPDEVADAVFAGLKQVHKENGMDMETNKKLLKKRIDKIDKTVKETFESGMSKSSQSLQKNIEEWETERRKLLIEEQEMIKITKTFFEQSNQLLEFCKDCHRAFLEGNADLKRKIIKIVCSNFSYDGSNIVIEPNSIFKAVIKNSLCNKKLPRLDSNQQPTG